MQVGNRLLHTVCSCATVWLCIMLYGRFAFSEQGFGNRSIFVKHMHLLVEENGVEMKRRRGQAFAKAYERTLFPSHKSQIIEFSESVKRYYFQVALKIGLTKYHTLRRCKKSMDRN